LLWYFHNIGAAVILVVQLVPMVAFRLIVALPLDGVEPQMLIVV
jgi:hypothetical protein